MAEGTIAIDSGDSPIIGILEKIKTYALARADCPFSEPLVQTNLADTALGFPALGMDVVSELWNANGEIYASMVRVAIMTSNTSGKEARDGCINLQRWVMKLLQIIPRKDLNIAGGNGIGEPFEFEYAFAVPGDFREDPTDQNPVYVCTFLITVLYRDDM